ncbi:MAG: HAMP domain-containing histidine kinase [Ruminococcus sp.]|nr:HAMP domain-containing histidine kinase [Ruminococcus sp.]
MIKKLQIKFIILSMTSLLVLITAIILGMNVINYNSVVNEADEVLNILSDNKGHFPKGGEKPDGQMPPNMSPEIPYESRYFSVLLDTSGSLIQTETSRIISVDSSKAVEYANAALEEESDRGFIDNFRYDKKTDGEVVRIVFLDCGRRMDAFLNFLFVSLGISLAGYLIVFLVISFFSGKIIRPIAESYEKQKRFITDAGHEIKTPLTIINADADVLEMEVGENEWLDDIKRQAKRLTGLTNDLVYLARMEESKDTMQHIEFPVSDVISETTASFQTLAMTQNKEFVSEIQPMISMKGDEKAIGQLTAILLDNALKYSPENGKVSLVFKKQSRQLILSVQNTTAASIPQKNLQVLFERFYRGDSSRNSKTGGYGIGLSIAKAIVSAHNGKIQAMALEENSLKFVVTFPDNAENMIELRK